ncbi:MAG: DEAD/DEAH box helicase [Anaerolineae bacterium]|nr:DEAD/DEAH box helicase [Anaerolineae bacterium]
MTDRPYQVEAVNAIRRAWETRKRVLAVMATGTGKTRVFSRLATECKGRTLVLVHREELAFQAAESLHRISGQDVCIEMADHWADTSLHTRSKFVVATVQTMQSRMDRHRPSDFSQIIVDEAHHATARSYQRVLDFLSPDGGQAKILGVTATPKRGDGYALGGTFDSVAFEYHIFDAISDGWLVPILQRSVKVKGLDYSGIGLTAGDLNQKHLSAVMEAERIVHEVVYTTMREAGDRKTILFSPSVAHADRCCEIFNRHKPDSACFIHGKTNKEERRDKIEGFKEGRYQYLCNVGIATEGFDVPGCSCVAIARPTRSHALYSQMVGRATRPVGLGSDAVSATPAQRRSSILDSSKPNALVLDFEGNAGRHKLVRVVDVLGGKHRTATVEAVRDRSVSVRSDVSVDIFQELNDAEAERLRKAAEDAARRARITGVAEYEIEDVDPFDELSIPKPSGKRGKFTKEATPRQIALLMSCGVPDAHLYTFYEARKAIDIVQQQKQSRSREVAASVKDLF